MHRSLVVPFAIVGCYVGNIEQLPIRVHFDKEFVLKFWGAVGVSAVLGVVIGCLLTVFMYRSLYTASNPFSEQLSRQAWSSQGKSPEEFEKMLKGGVRMLKAHSALFAAEVGWSEDKVLSAFGPPDRILMGTELARWDPHFRNTHGVYVYKLGRYGEFPDRIFFNVLTLSFDSRGVLTQQMINGLADDDPLATYDLEPPQDKRLGS
jgi:hypothetical protein